jgi:hypothetical protein
MTGTLAPLSLTSCYRAQHVLVRVILALQAEDYREAFDLLGEADGQIGQVRSMLRELVFERARS